MLHSMQDKMKPEELIELKINEMGARIDSMKKTQDRILDILEGIIKIIK